MAQIIDLNHNKPMKGERYFVDTNVWFWSTYVASKDMQLPNHPQDYQLSDYPRFLEDALNFNCTLCHSPLTFAEISNIIENTELAIYQETPGNRHCTKKEFRGDEQQRQNVLKEINMAWDIIQSMSECIDTNLNASFTEGAKNIMAASKLDPFDAFFTQIMRDTRIDCIISDDHDFCTYNDHIVVTANRRALRSN